MKFNSLMKNLLPTSDFDIEVSGLSLDSRDIKPGYMFVALPGEKNHGLDFAKQAIANGAEVILFELPGDIDYSALSVPCFKVDNLSSNLSKIAANFYNNPSRKMQVLAVTGTNGKSSIAFGLAEIAAIKLGKSAVIGTVGFGVVGSLKTATHTTPDAIALQKMLADFHSKEVKYVFMEASSHGLSQGRMSEVAVDVAMLTNLSRDHQDFHKTMEHYADSKSKLFKMNSVQSVALNINDDFGKKISKLLNNGKKIINYGVDIAHEGDYLSAENIMRHQTGSSFDLVSSWGSLSLDLNLLGDFNIENTLAMLAGFLLLGGNFADIEEVVGLIGPLNGRMECFKKKHTPLVVVDYAHTPDALAQALQALRSHLPDSGKLYCVFGCGGDRDQGKRPLMAQAANDFADFIIVTDDNPRSESPEDIVAQIMSGFDNKSAVSIIHDRHDAIFATVNSATKNDTVLIAGKGHETIQIIGSNKLYFNDAEKVKEAIC